MYETRGKSPNRGPESIGHPYAFGGTRRNLGLVLRWRLRLRSFLDSEALIIVGFWGFWLFMGGILIWLLSYCWYWGLVLTPS